MSDKPTKAYRSLKVHGTSTRTVDPDSAPQPYVLRPCFSDLMKRRPSVAPASTRPPNDNFDRTGKNKTDQDWAEVVSETAFAKAKAHPPEFGAQLDAVEAESAVPADAHFAPAIHPALATKPIPASQISDPLDHQLIEYIATTVTRFCNESAVLDGDGWQIRIALRADILPATTLHLSLSPHWLLLRFETSDERSRHLLSVHQETLKTSLDVALVPRRDVSITCD